MIKINKNKPQTTEFIFFDKTIKDWDNVGNSKENYNEQSSNIR